MPNNFKIATAVVDLTPISPVPMGGYGGPERLTRQLHGRLEANIVVLGEGVSVVVIVSLDTLFAGAAITTRIIDACMRRFGIGAERILVLASHTHFAPMMDASKPALGRADAEEVDRWGRAVTEAIMTAPPREAGSVRVGLGRSDCAVNRRLRWRLPTLMWLLGKTNSDIYVCDNPAGPRDPRIRTCVWRSTAGEPLAAFWSFACHPVSFPEPETASADYIGIVREALRRHLGVASLPVIFAPGCMGDVRPRSPRSWKALHRMPLLAVYGPRPVPFNRAAWYRWAATLATEVTTIEEGGEPRALDTSPSAAPMVCVPLDQIFHGSLSTPELHGKAIVVPGLGRIITLSCEPVSAIADMVHAGTDDIVLGYEGNVFGYLPTEAMIAEGGYESQGFLKAFGHQGAFKPGLDARIATLGRALKL